MTLTLLAPIASAQSVVGGYQYKGKVWAANPLPAQPKVSGHPLKGKSQQAAVPEPAGSRALKGHQDAAASWPVASTSTVALAGAGAGAGAAAPQAAAAAPTPVANSPITVAPGDSGAPSSVQVKTADHGGAQAANVDGLLFGLTRADGTSDAGKVAVSVDYGSIAQAYGGGWASRLHLVSMPSCALTTPDVPACRTQQPLATTNDPVSHKLTATVAVPGTPVKAQGATGAVQAAAVTQNAGTAVAAVANAAGSQGNYAATPLSASGSWSQSASGAFTYQYPIDTPPALGGSAPSVGLSYDSQSVDGETSSRNSQSSWIGDGWDYSPGYIERDYKSCANDGITGSADECWAGYNATLSLGSHTGQLVRDSNGVYHLQADDGTKVEDLSGASNGMWNGEYFKVTTTDGTQYFFGLNHAPGTTSDAATNSAWGVPVYNPKPGDPCYNSAQGNNSQCAAEMGWRFNLDFVVDANNNVQRYDWANETNWYNMGYGQVAQSGAGGSMIAYTRGGYLQQISYGYKLADEQAGRDPDAKVVFNTGQRCTTSSSVCQYGNLNGTTATNWPDTPYDLNCTQGMATSGNGSNVCQVASPTFWSTYRLQSISTSVKVGSTWQPVDSYALNQIFSDAGATVDPVTGKTVDPADAGALQSVMWLSSIQHTGQDTSAGGSGAITLDPVTFTGTEMDNRVDGLTPAAPPLFHPRISSIQTETGESIAVTYRAPECSRVNNHMPASADSDTMGCYQVYWTTPGGSAPIADWFNKTLISTITDNDASKAGSPAKVTNYAYSGGAAWHRDDSDLTDDQYRTWNDFRGYRTVTTTTGSAPDPVSQTVATYFQGMDGDYKADGTQRSVSLTDPNGDTATDSNWRAGVVQEADTYTQAGGTIVSKALSTGPVFTTTATAPRTAWTSKSPAPATLSTLPPMTALRLQSSVSRQSSLLANGTWRTTETDTTADSLGRPVKVDAKGDVTVPSQETCTTTSYAGAPASNPMMLMNPAETITVAGGCGTAASASTTISDKRYFYDGDGSLTNPGTLGQVGGNGTTVGMVTATQAAQSYDSSGNPVFQTLGAVQYDQYGRPTRTLDSAGSATTDSYSPSTATLPTVVSSTNPLGWTTTDTYDPARGLTTHAVDANGRVTDSTFDALGRTTATWLPGRDKNTQTADKLFSYSVHGVGNPDPSTVTTQTLREDGSYSTAIQFYDGFLQERQTQTTTADNSAGRLIASTHYDSHGLTHSSVPAFVDTTTAPTTTMFVETENSLPSETVSAYDGLDRPVSSTLYSQAQPLWTSTVAYPGADETDSTPPPGSPAGSTFTDALGRTTSTVVHGGSGIGDVTTKYGYNAVGRLGTVSDNAGNTWSYSYDLTGRPTSQTDPDTGTSFTTYDQVGNVASTKDGRGQILSYSYDLLGRMTGEYNGAGTTDPTKQLTSEVYDTLAKGYLTSSTRYDKGSAYTQAVTGYNTAYQPSGSTVTIPSAEGALAGTYSISSKYTPNTGLLSDTIYGNEGGLPSEDVGYGYNLQGGLVSTGTMFTPYLDVASYSPLGQIEQSTFGVLGKQLRTAQTYDDATGRVTTNRVSIQPATTNPISSTTYGYDQSGNLTTTSELQSSGGTDQAFDTQCFQYDGLDRLTTAWTDTAGQTSPTAGQLAHCTSGSPAPASIGGPAPYWQSYSYNLLGDRTQYTNHDTSGNTANDITQTSTYPGGGTTAANQPNTATSISTTKPGTGTSTITPQYDAAGNTTSRITTGPAAGNQTFTYDPEGRTSTVTTTVGTGNPANTGYLYDAGGNLLIQRGPTATVLYLFGGAEQLTLTGGTVTGQRFYGNPDGTVLLRSSNGALTYEPTNVQGTSQLEVSASNLAITRRSYDPYGNARGPVPNLWADNHGYLGKPTDPTTGLDLLGARQYDPAIGRFLSADPIFEAGDPNQMGGYAYAGDNPSTSSDPSGLISWGGAWNSGVSWLHKKANQAGTFVAGAADGAIGSPVAWAVNKASDGWNHAADAWNNFAETHDGIGGSMFDVGHTGHMTDTPFGSLFNADTNSGAYKRGFFVGAVGSLLIPGSQEADAAKAAEAADGGGGIFGFLKRLFTHDDPHPTPHDGPHGGGSGGHGGGGGGGSHGGGGDGVAGGKPTGKAVHPDTPATGTGAKGADPVIGGKDPVPAGGGKPRFTVDSSGSVSDRTLQASPGRINLASEDRTSHILRGGMGRNGWSGGHMYPGNPGKTLFPTDWSADDIMENVSDIATDPNAKVDPNSGGPGGALFYRSGRPASFKLWGERNGVCIRVIVEPMGRGIVTAFPDAGAC
ncbi:RHS repeat-associated core domain-containing protein [Kitasatospora viridis]|nr:RHS repeat-associated core domain-containing protein [Kitasatospora viridis]